MERGAWASVLACLILTTCSAEQWPGWRGPRHDGTSHATGLPLEWSTQKNIVWNVPIPGTGHSSPIIWDDRIFLTTCIETTQERKLLCLDRLTGKQLWDRAVVTSPLEKKHTLNSFASSTPTTDGHHVWVTFLAGSDVVVACYDIAGGQVWKTKPSEFYSMHGFCSPPLVYQNLVIINCDHDVKEGAPDAALIALDKLTGREVWRTSRPNRTRSYCPPIVFATDRGDQLIISGSKCIASYDPKTGKELWLIDGPTEQFAASLVQLDGLLFMTGGYPERHLMAIRPDGTGNVTKSHIAWHQPREAAYVPSPLAIDHLLYMVTDEGILTCFDAKTGTRHYKQRLGKKFLASPIAADGYIYFPDQEGITHVLKIGPTFEVIARNDLKEEIFASPAVAGKNLFIRTASRLYCIGESR